MAECCLRGFRWGGQPKGKTGKIAGLDSYLTGTNGDAAVLIIADLYGWTFPNIRLLADHYAEEAGVTAFVPDFFGGELLPFDILSQPDRRDWDKLDLPSFMSRNRKDIREPEICAVAKVLKSQYKRLGAVGFCYGGWAVFKLGSQEKNGLVDCIATAHPSLLENQEIDRVSVPVQILAPEHDDMFSEDLKAHATAAIPKLGVAFDYQYFPGLQHAFAVRGDPSNTGEQNGMERAKDCVVMWLRQWLRSE